MMSQPAELEKLFYPTNTISSPEDIVAGLLPLVQNSTTVDFAESLLNYVGKITHKRPRDTETICKALSHLLDDPEIQKKKLDGPDYFTTFGQALALALSEEINDGLDDVYSDDDDGNLSINTTNIRLTAALLSASAIRHNLQHVGQHIPLSTVLLGLQNPHMTPEPEKNEVYGVIAIIHLAVVGDMMCETLGLSFSGEEGVIQALKSLKDKGVFKSPPSVKLLECAIENSESGYEKNISANEAWDLLFPGNGFLQYVQGLSRCVV